MRVVTTLTGTSPLVMHNIRLARWDDEFTKAIGVITSKKSKQTDDDRHEVQRLEFAGSLYVDDQGPYLPAANVRKCLVGAARIRRLGRNVERALIPMRLQSYLDYDGPRGVSELWADPTYRYSAIVGVNRAKVGRMRPQFPSWSVTMDWELLTDMFNYEDLVAVVNAAGLIEGIGDNRVNGFGRFTAVVTQS